MVKIQVKISKDLYKKFQIMAIYTEMNHSQLMEKIILDAENPVWKNILDGEEVSLKKQKGA